MSKFGESSSGSVDGSTDGSTEDSIDGSMNDSLAALLFWSKDFLCLKSSASGRELSRFVPTSSDVSGVGSFDGAVDGSDDGLFARTGSFSVINSSTRAELRVRSRGILFLV